MDIPETWHSGGVKYHRVAMIEDEGRVICLYRHWRQEKRRWQYSAGLAESVAVMFGLG